MAGARLRLVVVGGVCLLVIAAAGGPRPPLAIVEHQPVGQLTDGWGPVTVRFDRPVVPLRAGETRDATGMIAISPAVSGKESFKAPDLLVFEPDKNAPLPAATAFTVTVPATVRALDGQRLERPFRFSFETARPSCAAKHLGRFDGAGRLAPRGMIFISCNTAPVRAELGRWVKATAGGKPWPVEVQTLAELSRTGQPGRAPGVVESDQDWRCARASRSMRACATR